MKTTKEPLVHAVNTVGEMVITYFLGGLKAELHPMSPYVPYLAGKVLDAANRVPIPLQLLSELPDHLQRFKRANQAIRLGFLDAVANIAHDNGEIKLVQYAFPFEKIYSLLRKGILSHARWDAICEYFDQESHIHIAGKLVSLCDDESLRRTGSFHQDDITTAKQGLEAIIASRQSGWNVDVLYLGNQLTAKHPKPIFGTYVARSLK